MRGLIAIGLTGTTITGGVAGVRAGVGNPKPIPMALFLNSNASMVNGLSVDSTSVRRTPVELPNGKIIRPAFMNGGNRCGSPMVISAVSSLMRSTPVLTLLFIGKMASVPLTYSTTTLAVVQSFACISRSSSKVLNSTLLFDTPEKSLLRPAVI